MAHIRIIAICSLWVSVLAGYTYAGEKEFPEANIKVAFIFNFLRFIEWPEDDSIKTHICVIGKKQKYLTAFQNLRGRILNDEQLVIEELGSGAPFLKLEHCRLIFIPATSSEQESIIINALKETNTLTVGESRNFINRGGMINFIEQKDRIRFEINLTAVHETKIRITSKILRIAKNVIK